MQLAVDLVRLDAEPLDCLGDDEPDHERRDGPQADGEHGQQMIPAEQRMSKAGGQAGALMGQAMRLCNRHTQQAEDKNNAFSAGADGFTPVEKMIKSGWLFII